MLEKIVESFLSKAGEKLFEYSEHRVRDVTDYESTLRTLETKLRELVAKASDVEDESNKEVLTGRKKRKRGVVIWLEEVEKLETEIRTFESEVESQGFVSRFLGGDRAAKLKERADELVDQSTRFGELVLDVDRTKGEALLTGRLVGEAFEENFERIWTFLTADNVKSIGIYGMGGVGKTTLTKHINNRLLEETQECVYWVTVSQEVSIKMLQDKIAHVIGVDLSHEFDEDKRAARLHRALSSIRKKSVLILDDVWKNINLEKVGDPLRVEGCRLILTTRSSRVCDEIGCQKVIAVKTLEENEAWSLFSETLGQETVLSSQVEEIAKRMSKVCDGLPLGIITIAGSMRRVSSIHTWRDALAELKEYSSMGQDDDLPADGVFKVLKYSFDRLDPKHRRCFLYCSLYPEDDEISREELVRKLILEELMDKRKSREAQIDQGHSILDKLVNICLLESARDSDGNDCVKMHDLLRAMALKITQGKHMVLAGCQLFQIPNEEEYWTKDLEKMSLMVNQIGEIPDGMAPNCPNLSTLLLDISPLRFIADSFFLRMHGLCTLDLSFTGIEELPNSLSELESLKALLLGHCTELVYVPNLGKLKALKELDLSNTAIKKVPQGMDKLVNLKFLSMDGMDDLEILPTGLLLNLPYLQCLHLPFHMLAPIEEIERLKQLEEFWGRVDDVSDFNRLIRSRPHIKYRTFVGSHVDDVGDSNGVIVSGCNLRKDVPMLAHDIQHLQFIYCEGRSKCLLDDFPLFNNPKSLKNLTIDICRGTECILTNDQFLMMAEREELESHFLPLQTLEEIELHCLPDFMGIIHKQEIGVALPTPTGVLFSSLRKLTITGCHKMKKLGVQPSVLPNLEEISVEWCDNLQEIIHQGEGEAGDVSFPKLKKLVLRYLPKLESICKATMICDSIVEITLIKCPALKKLPLSFPLSGQSSNYPYCPPPALKSICMATRDEEWWESLEWEHPAHKHLLQPFLKYY